MPNGEEPAIRAADLLLNVMNLAAVLKHAPSLQASDPVELRSTLLEIADEMTWLGTIVARGGTSGISWPEDAAERIEHLRSLATAWDPVGPPSAEVQSAARRCLGILQPGMSRG